MPGAETTVTIDAAGVYYRDLNARLRGLVAGGAGKILIENAQGQRYIGTDLDKPVEIEIHGTPGNDLGAFMNGPRITVYANVQDGAGNTMNDGRIVVHGRAGDTVGLATRGGAIYVRDSVGYRAGIHMKEYGDKKPVIVIGGTAQDFAGEYMAGGVLVLLGLNLRSSRHAARFVATGMHGGVIYYHGNIEEHQLGKEVGVAQLTDEDVKTLTTLVAEYARLFGMDAGKIMDRDYRKLYPKYLRPYGRLYTY